MQVFLRDHVAAGRERRVLLANEGGIDGFLTAGVLRSVDEAEQIAGIEEAKSMHLVDRRHRIAESAQDLTGELETEVEVLRANMEEQVAGSGDGMARAARISRKACNSARRGWPKQRSQASDPMPIAQDRLAFRLRNPTARTSAAEAGKTSGRHCGG